MVPFGVVRSVLFRLDAERAHELTVAALKRVPLPPPPALDPRLATTIAGISLSNPLGLAAGFDKNAEVPHAMLRLGFGFVEIGTLTPKPQAGNPRPRIFRLPADGAVINRLGFNNGGLEEALERLRHLGFPQAGCPLGINVGANKDSADRIADYEEAVRIAAQIADYIAINVSSPNTPGLRALQSRDALAELLARCLAARGARAVPVFVKISPDLSDVDIVDIAEVAMASGVAGLIISNTTTTRPSGLECAARNQAGGLSGVPLTRPALETLAAFRQSTARRLPLIGVGGINDADTAYTRIRAGASVVQLYTGLIYGGPGLPRRVLRELSQLLAADGYSNVADAVGADAPR